jgi:hypothetical protein
VNRGCLHLLQGGGHRGKALSLRTVQYCRAVLHKALRDACRFGLLDRNVTESAT